MSEKQYGFIKGDDNKDYFFHQKDFMGDKELLCEGSYLEFEQCATPKGYSAKKIKFVNKTTSISYIVPNGVFTSKESQVKGWELMELSDWCVHAEGNSPDEAREEMKLYAQILGANALVNVKYFKTTGESGNYRFSIHNYSGRVANIAKKNSNGDCKKEDFQGINKRAETLKYSNRTDISPFYLFIVPLIILFMGIVLKIQIISAIGGLWLFCGLVFTISTSGEKEPWLKKF